MSNLSNTAVCEFCGKKYTRGRKWQQYCTRTCKEKGYYIQKGKEAQKEKNERTK